MSLEWTIGLFALLAHLHLVLLFWPSYWRPIDERGIRWTTLLTPIGIPAWCAAVLLLQMLEGGRGLATPFLLVAGLGLGACTATLVLAMVRLRRMRAPGGESG